MPSAKAALVGGDTWSAAATAGGRVTSWAELNSPADPGPAVKGSPILAPAGTVRGTEPHRRPMAMLGRCQYQRMGPGVAAARRLALKANGILRSHLDPPMTPGPGRRCRSVPDTGRGRSRGGRCGIQQEGVAEASGWGDRSTSCRRIKAIPGADQIGDIHRARRLHQPRPPRTPGRRASSTSPAIAIAGAFSAVRHQMRACKLDAVADRARIEEPPRTNLSSIAMLCGRRGLFQRRGPPAPRRRTELLASRRYVAVAPGGLGVEHQEHGGSARSAATGLPLSSSPGLRRRTAAPHPGGPQEDRLEHSGDRPPRAARDRQRIPSGVRHAYHEQHCRLVAGERRCSNPPRCSPPSPSISSTISTYSTPAPVRCPRRLSAPWPSWRRWRDLLERCSLSRCPRPGEVTWSGRRYCGAASMVGGDTRGTSCIFGGRPCATMWVSGRLRARPATRHVARAPPPRAARSRRPERSSPLPRRGGMMLHPPSREISASTPSIARRSELTRFHPRATTMRRRPRVGPGARRRLSAGWATPSRTRKLTALYWEFVEIGSHARSAPIAG